MALQKLVVEVVVGRIHVGLETHATVIALVDPYGLSVCRKKYEGMCNFVDRICKFEYYLSVL